MCVIRSVIPLCTVLSLIVARGAVGDNAVTGSAAEVRIISEGKAVCNNIYGEMPFMDAGSRYVIYLRFPDGLRDDGEERRNTEVWRADLKTGANERVATGVYGVRGMGISPDLRHFYYVAGRDKEKPSRESEADGLTRLDIVTLERKTVKLQGPGRRITTLGAISKDGIYYAGAFLGPQRYGITRTDPDTGQMTVIHESNAEIFNAHPQIEPGQGKDLLLQHNRGARLDDTGKVIKPYGPMGTTLYLIDLDGDNRRTLNVGSPHTPTIQGHEAWIGQTGGILFTTHWQSPKLRAERGNIWMIRPGDEKPRPVARGYTFWHCSASRCGRYFIADTLQGAVVPNPDASKAKDDPYVVTPMPKRGLIVVGSIATGKTCVLSKATADLSGGQYRHPHPYLSPDRQWAIFNTCQDDIPQVAAARIPDGLLDQLDQKENRSNGKVATRPRPPK